uniref:Uncharacterized protein n=1 Tax=Zea mays TaxID=4577 RepID=B4FXK4_MAIZE|nr:unknown [Zea mays]
MILNTVTTTTSASCLLTACKRSSASLKITRKTRTKKSQLMHSCPRQQLKKPFSTPWTCMPSIFCKA